MIKCEECGKYIPYRDIENGTAKHSYIPDSDYSRETYSTVCMPCVTKIYVKQLQQHGVSVGGVE